MRRRPKLAIAILLPVCLLAPYGGAWRVAGFADLPRALWRGGPFPAVSFVTGVATVLLLLVGAHRAAQWAGLAWLLAWSLVAGLLVRAGIEFGRLALLLRNWPFWLLAPTWGLWAIDVARRAPPAA
jgi:hypothetical protein